MGHILDHPGRGGLLPLDELDAQSHEYGPHSSGGDSPDYPRCPNCGAELVSIRSGRAHCHKCNWTGKVKA